MDFQIDKIDFWQQRCSDFWNLFYSYLILNQYNINISNLNFYTGESGTGESGTGESGTDSFVNKLKVQEETIQNDCINLLLQKQQFEINNQYYEIPQNFLGIEFEETESMIKILFYYFDENEQEEDAELDGLKLEYKNYFNPFNIDISSGGGS